MKHPSLLVIKKPEPDNQRPSKYAIPGYTLKPCDGYWQTRKINLTAERIKIDPRFSKTRQQVKSFRQVLLQAQQVRRSLLAVTGIKKVIQRLTSILSTESDDESLPLPAYKAGWQFNKMFDLNSNERWAHAISLPWHWQYDQQQQQFSFHVPAYRPTDYLHPSQPGMYYRIQAAVISNGGTGQLACSDWLRSGLLPIKQITVAPLVLTGKIDNPHWPQHRLLLHIQWYQKTPGDQLIKSKWSGPAIITLINK